MPDDNTAIQQEDRFDSSEAPEPRANEDETKADGFKILSAEAGNESTILVGMLGHVNFDGKAADNTTSEAMAWADHRKLFRREVYVGIKDTEQNIEFLGRIVQGPFHTPHEIDTRPAKTKKTAPQPKQTKNRSSYDVYGNIEVLGQLLHGERVIPTPTRPRPYSEIYIFPPERLRKLLELEGNMLL